MVRKSSDPEGLNKTPQGKKMTEAEQYRRYIAKLEKMGELGTRVRALELRLNFPGRAPAAPQGPFKTPPASTPKPPSGGGGTGRGGSRVDGGRGGAGGGGESGILRKKVR